MRTPFRRVCRSFCALQTSSRIDVSGGDGLGGTVATVAPASYAGSVGSDAADVALGLNNDGWGDGIFFRNSSVRMAGVVDGASQTVIVLERPGEMPREPGAAPL